MPDAWVLDVPVLPAAIPETMPRNAITLIAPAITRERAAAWRRRGRGPDGPFWGSTYVLLPGISTPSEPAEAEDRVGPP
ncbi:MAG TPA: hypothetical protein VE646_06225 [Actinomycetota bacterium]|nr:hypothetical protein [Actinomycetota bacterium]